MIFQLLCLVQRSVWLCRSVKCTAAGLRMRKQRLPLLQWRARQRVLQATSWFTLRPPCQTFDCVLRSGTKNPNIQRQQLMPTSDDQILIRCTIMSVFYRQFESCFLDEHPGLVQLVWETFCIFFSILSHSQNIKYLVLSNSFACLSEIHVSSDEQKYSILAPPRGPSR